MSIASEITRINTNIAAAYDEAEAKGATMPATENSANLAQTVASIPTGSTPTLQSKTVTPTTSQQSVTPDSGYDGLSDVTVNATPLEAKTVTPTSQQQVVTPTAPNIGLSSVTVGVAPTPTLITKQITENGTYTAADDNADGYSEVTVEVGTPPVEEKYINFIDDDGTILYSWTEQELQEATELPPLPTEEGWIYQEWTWTLQEIKDNKFPMDVGVSRTPSNGASVRADCYFLENDNKNVYIKFNAKNDIVDVDWGDGTVDAYTFDSQSYLSQSVTANHVYTRAGKYTIYLTLRNKTGKISEFSPNTRANDSNILGTRITLIGLGNNYEKIKSYDFYGMVSLKRLSFASDSISFVSSIIDWLSNCYSLKCICFPRSISPTSYARTFYETQGIEHIILPPNAKIPAGQFITTGTSIKRFNVPRSMNVLPIFTQSFGLLYIYIPKSITRIQAQSFYSLRKLQFVDLSDYDDPTKIPILDNVNAFNNTNLNAKLYVRNQSMLNAFSTATNWSTYAAQFVIGGKFAEVTS